jgi:hypothetical protein
MRLEDLESIDTLVRPAVGKKIVKDGEYDGIIIDAELVETTDKFIEGVERPFVVLKIKVEVNCEDEGLAELELEVPYSWYRNGEMVKTLKKLNKLIEEGESMQLKELKGIAVKAVVGIDPRSLLDDDKELCSKIEEMEAYDYEPDEPYEPYDPYNPFFLEM